MKSTQKTFTWIELIIVVVVLGILVAVAINAYQDHLRKTRFSEVVNALAPYKDAVEYCAKDGSCLLGGTLSGLGVGKSGVPPSISTTYMARVAVATDGTITATASKAGGLDGETFVLTPTYVKGSRMTWTVSGTCKTRAGGPIC
jgi:type IV pilus assembly protein PilA